MMIDPAQPDSDAGKPVGEISLPQQGTDNSTRSDAPNAISDQGALTQQPSSVPSPTNFTITPNQAIMMVVTVVGAILVVNSLRRMNTRKKPPAPAKLGGDMDQLLALRNEMYAKYPPPAKATKQSPRTPSPSNEPNEPALRLVDDRRPTVEHPGEIAALRQQVEQLTHQVAHLQIRMRDLEGERQGATFGISQSAINPPSAAVNRGVPTTPSQSTQPSDHENVYRLADRGMNAVEIAKTLGKHTGQVELILNLRRATGS